ncbi:MAG: DUF3783 domain-containing protein [Parasporobacterium sp.]|nr:DUF3783 domain-containing protein [Parasporobacterium sp.]
MKTILYRIKENMLLVQKEKAFLNICSELHITAKKILPEHGERKISELLMLPECSSAQENSESDFPEVLVFSGFSDTELDRFLAAYKEQGLQPIALKAVATPFNMNWTLKALLTELEKEHRQLNR